MPLPTVDAMFGRPNWLEHVRTRVAPLSPAILADFTEVLALALRERTSEVVTGRAHVSRSHDV